MPTLEQVILGLTGLSTLALVVKTLYIDTVLKGRRDRHDLDAAAETQPQIKEQLEAGNFEMAGKGMLLAQEVMTNALKHLQSREQALEAESAGWQKQAQEAVQRALAADQRAERAETRAEACAASNAELSERCDRLESELRAIRGEPTGP